MFCLLLYHELFCVIKYMCYDKIIQHLKGMINLNDHFKFYFIITDLKTKYSHFYLH